jgi:hypothetical protein
VEPRTTPNEVKQRLEGFTGCWEDAAGRLGGDLVRRGASFRLRSVGFPRAPTANVLAVFTGQSRPRRATKERLWLVVCCRSWCARVLPRPRDRRDISRPPFAVQTHADSGPRVARRRSPHLADGALDATGKRASWARFRPAARELAEVEGSASTIGYVPTLLHRLRRVPCTYFCRRCAGRCRTTSPSAQTC